MKHCTEKRSITRHSPSAESQPTPSTGGTTLENHWSQTTANFLNAMDAINSAVIKKRNEEYLLRETCRVITKDRNYPMAWIGFLEEYSERRVRPVAQAGFGCQVLLAPSIIPEDTAGGDPTGTAIRTGAVSICRNMQTASRVDRWTKQAIRHGYPSAIAFPLKFGEKVFGALTVYARRPDAFGENEVHLFSVLTGTLACGITAIRSDLAVQQAQRALEESEIRYRLLSETAGQRMTADEFRAFPLAVSDTLLLLSPEMEIVWTNRSTSGLSRALVPPDTKRPKCHELICKESLPCRGCPARRCLTSRKEETETETRNGAVLGKKAFPILEAGRVTSVIMVIADITEKMTMQAAMMQAGHMASLGELAAEIAHEINNPITGLINYGQILVNECKAGSLERDIGTRIVKEGEKISRIVQNLLSSIRDQRKKKRPNKVAAILEDAIVLPQAQFKKEGIALCLDIPTDLPDILANSQEIQQGFINIINNARYALNEKYPERHENKRLHISATNIAVRGKAYVRIIFHDHGTGVAARDLPLLTKPLFSTKPFRQGTGLGLNITRKFIADHGGSLRIESVEGEFTKVIIDLPIADKT
jgi:signal transduction histidine kinase